jgi:hypothetical protein
MITRILALLAINAVTAWGQIAAPFAKSDRILTIESWQNGEGKIWAVQHNQIVIYAQKDPNTFELILKKPLSPHQVQAIHEAISALPQDAYGFQFVGEYSTNAPLLRLHFTSDGEWTRGRIEATGQLPVWMKPLVDAVSAACPPEWRVDFEANSSAYLMRLQDQVNIPAKLRSRYPEIVKYRIPELRKNRKSWWEIWK